MRNHASVRKSMLALASALALFIATPGQAQDAYPSKPITFIVPYAAGGSSDTRSRQIAQQLSTRLKVAVVVENKPGASGNIGTAQIARANPDGYTIGLGNFAPLSVNKALYGSNLGFDPDKGIAPILLLERGAMVLGVNAQSPYKSAGDLIAAGKADPKKLNFASTGAGSASQLITELFKDNAGFNATHVPYRGGAPAAGDLMAGNVDFYLELPSLLLPNAQGDQARLRLLAVSADTRLAALPNIPTFKELGIANMVASNWFGVIAPAGTPQPIIDKLNTNLNEILKDPAYRRVVESEGGEVAGGSPQDFTSFIASESKRWGTLISEKHITIQ